MENEKKVFKPTSYAVYARANAMGRVIKIFSTLFEKPKEGDVFLKKGTGDEFVHVGYYELCHADGTHKYRVAGDTMVECTKEELEEELATFPAPRPTTNERMDEIELFMADILYELSLGQFGDIETT